MDFIDEMTNGSSQLGNNFAGTFDKGNYYELLEIPFGASKVQVREAYIRLKRTYENQSQALYSVLSADEAKDSLSAIEDAYRILDDVMLRQAYDEKLKRSGVISDESIRSGASSDPFAIGFNEAEGDNLFKERIQYMRSRQEEETERNWASSEIRGPNSESQPNDAQPRELLPIKRRATLALDPEIRAKAKDIIDNGDRGDGDLLRQLRVLFDVSEDEMQERIKILLEYVRAIENNAFEKLPPLVYVRGFIKSYLLYLGVEEHRPLVEAYTEKFKLWQQTRQV